MTNPPVEHEPVGNQSNPPLSAAALEFANILGGAFAQQWIQEQTDASHSARPSEPDVSPDTEVPTHLS